MMAMVMLEPVTEAQLFLQIISFNFLGGKVTVTDFTAEWESTHAWHG